MKTSSHYAIIVLFIWATLAAGYFLNIYKFFMGDAEGLVLLTQAVGIFIVPVGSIAGLLF